MKSVLPKGCEFVGMTTDGIVGRYWNSISQEMNCRSFQSKSFFCNVFLMVLDKALFSSKNNSICYFSTKAFVVILGASRYLKIF